MCLFLRSVQNLDVFLIFFTWTILGLFYYRKTYFPIYQTNKTIIKIPSKLTVAGSNPAAITSPKPKVIRGFIVFSILVDKKTFYVLKRVVFC